MSEFESDSKEQSASAKSEVVSFEVIPQLASSEEFYSKAARLYELKEMHDQLFRKTDEKKHDPGGEFEILKTELGAMALTAGVKSVGFMGLNITNADGGETKGEITGARLLDALDIPEPSAASNDPVLLWKYFRAVYAIAAAAKKIDANAALERGIAPSALEMGREPSKPRAASVRVEWARKRGFAAVRAGSKQSTGGGNIQ